MRFHNNFFQTVHVQQIFLLILNEKMITQLFEQLNNKNVKRLTSLVIIVKVLIFNGYIGCGEGETKVDFESSSLIISIGNLNFMVSSGTVSGDSLLFPMCEISETKNPKSHTKVKSCH